MTDHARLVLEKRYLKRDLSGRVVETPAEMFLRVARAVAVAEENDHGPAGARAMAEDFFNCMSRLEFLPNSPTLMNAGRELGQLSACFVLPVGDSIESIFNAVRDTALIHKSGGGTGFSFSSIRPARDLVQSTLGVSSGPVSFMNVFDVATETIKQGGVRRGANMGILSVHHPDILEFITVKANQPERFGNFNLSVSVTDRFMEAALHGQSYDLINPHSPEVRQSVSAAEVLDLMVQAAWACGDPGLVFIDRVNQDNPLPHLGPIEATNPCGEQPLLPYESCTLGSLNLARFVGPDGIDFSRLGQTIDLAVRFLDDVLDATHYPLAQIRTVSLANRKIGLGVMGLADAFIMMGIPYQSEAALEMSRRLMAFIQTRARESSSRLARVRGPFPNWTGSRHQAEGRVMRNATTTTIAPTGSLSIIAGCSSGIEPVYALAYGRRVMDQENLVEINRLFLARARKDGFWSESLKQALVRTGSVQGRPDVPQEVRRLFETALDIDPLWHLEIQSAFQAHTDNAVSKTVNLPSSAGPETIKKIFIQAFRLGLKGVTVYRDRSKGSQVFSPGLSGSSPNTFPDSDPVDGPCPECGEKLTGQAGCWVCRSCGYSRCL